MFRVFLFSKFKCVFSYSVMSDSLQPHGLSPAKLLSPWNFLSKNTGVGCHFLLQGFFLTPGSNPCLLASFALAGIFLTTSATWKAKICVK